MTAKERYEKLKRRRQPFLDRAYAAAALTVPSLLPPTGHNAHSKLNEPYQDYGAKGVVFLASRILTALYPPGFSSFRLAIPAHVLMSNGQMDMDEDTEQALILSEKLISSEIERRGWRHPTNVAMQHLIVSGNVGEMMMPDNKLRMFRLDQYVVVRDPAGNLKEFITAEVKAKASLSDSLQSLADTNTTGGAGTDDEDTTLYTHGVRGEDDQWEIHQELGDSEIADSRGTYEICPFNALRWTAVLGEDYGRGKCEEHLPALKSADALAQSVSEGAGMASRHITLVRPNATGGLNLRRRLAKEGNGAIVTGNPEDVTMLNFTNTSGLQIAQVELQEIKKDLMVSFLMNMSAQRSGERVTAFEIQRMTEDLEGALGGVYSMLAQDMQAHRIKRLIFQMQDQGALPDWPAEMVEPIILTGLEALGRQNDVNRARAGMEMISQLPPEDQLYIKKDVLLKKAFHGLDLADAVRTEKEVEEMRQQQAQQNMMTNVAEAGGVAAAQAAGASVAGTPPGP
jgi:hypothetical protein